MSRAATRTPNRPRTFHATSSTAEAEPNPDLHQLLWHLVTAHRGRAGRRPSGSSSPPTAEPASSPPAGPLWFAAVLLLFTVWLRGLAVRQARGPGRGRCACATCWSPPA